MIFKRDAIFDRNMLVILKEKKTRPINQIELYVYQSR